MKRTLMILAFLALPSLVAVLIYRYRTAPLQQLAQGRSLVGTRSGSAYLQQLVWQQPRSAEAHFLHGRQLRLEDNPTDATEELKLAAELGWPVEQIERERLLCAAQVAFAQNEPMLTRWLARAPDDRDLLLGLARGYEASRRPERAEVLTNQVLARSPDDADTLFLRGRVRMRLGHAEHARADLEQSLRSGSDWLHEADARLLLANCLLDLGRFEEALALYRECRAAQPANPVALFGMGRAAIFLNQYDEAEKALAHVLELRPNHPDTLLELALVKEWRGDLPGALELLQRAEQTVPDRPELLSQMAKVLRVLGRPDEAQVYGRRFTEQQQRGAGKQLPARIGP